MSELTRRDFLRHSILMVAGAAFISCDDDSEEENNDSPGALSGNKPSKQIIIVGASVQCLHILLCLFETGLEIFCHWSSPTATVEYSHRHDGSAANWHLLQRLSGRRPLLHWPWGGPPSSADEPCRPLTGRPSGHRPFSRAWAGTMPLALACTNAP